MLNARRASGKPQTGQVKDRVGTMAAPIVGDVVDVSWGDDRRDAGVIERILAGTAALRISGPPEIAIVIAIVQLREAGPNRWHLEL